MRFILTFTVLLVSSPGLADPPAAVRRAGKSLVLVVDTRDHQVMHSTGVCISPTYIVTTKHGVVNNQVEVQFPGENRNATAELVAGDDNLDLALLRVIGDPSKTWVAVAPASTPVENLAQVYGVRLREIQEGQVIATEGGSYYTSFGAMPGNSGSGLFADDGQLVGICKAFVLPGSPLAGKGIYVRLDHLHGFLAKHWPEYANPPPQQRSNMWAPWGGKYSLMDWWWLVIVAVVLLGLLYKRKEKVLGTT